VDLKRDVLALEGADGEEGAAVVRLRLQLSTGDRPVAGWRLVLGQIFGLEPAEVNRLKVTRTGFGVR
jgi:hypothetical protein